LRAEGLKYREIAAALGISIPSVGRILKEAGGKK
jgi:DNA-directed RNA polymerase specialized sigma24 family protein